MDRETKTIVTPVSKQEVVVKTWLTGKERRFLSQSFKKSSKISFDNKGNPEMKMEATGELMDEIVDRAINTIVVSVNGVKEKVLDAVLNMKEEDSDFVAKEVTKISQGVGFTKPESKTGKDTD